MTGPTWDDVMVPNYGTPGRTLVSGSECTVTDDAGNRYLDLLAGIAVNVLGHAHPRVVAAVQEQVATLAHVSNLYAHPKGLELASRLRQLAGGGHKTLFVNSGTEANEAALKLVRKRAADAGRDGVVLAFEKSFHGRTLGSLALTGQPKHQAGFGPLPGGVVTVPYNDPSALEAAFEAHEVIGVFAEFVQGEGGITPMTPETAATLARLCARHDALLVADEVQTGVGRTGRFFAFEHFALVPDVITMAKGLGGGLPTGAVLVKDAYASVLGPGTHGCTFGGNPVSCAAALAVLDTLEEEGLIAEAGRKGALLQEALAAAGLPSRGLGLLLGIPVPDAAAVRLAAQEAGFLVGQAGPDVVRLAPPLIISDEELLLVAPVLAKAVAPTLTTG